MQEQRTAPNKVPSLGTLAFLEVLHISKVLSMLTLVCDARCVMCDVRCAMQLALKPVFVIIHGGGFVGGAPPQHGTLPVSLAMSLWSPYSTGLGCLDSSPRKALLQPRLVDVAMHPYQPASPPTRPNARKDTDGGAERGTSPSASSRDGTLLSAACCTPVMHIMLMSRYDTRYFQYGWHHESSILHF